MPITPPPNYKPPSPQKIDDFTGIQECDLCGALVRKWGTHEAWHLALTTGFQMLSAVVAVQDLDALADPDVLAQVQWAAGLAGDKT